ncbi:hypothetical protein [Catenisphaera adipataccumulans]|uniref:Lipoprotein n=1 Tax=Catenisphaera adipataccumulans TaxID=700500 RepID=A0A7W8CYI0_9FIRM|nr:hypothetical protein [Catenisphaera adipataccumulans]MBB5183721.1 hypothetical protein [Catenisphaera adipataccumulans]
MKKLLTILLSGLLVFSISACQSTETNTSQTTSTSSTSTSSADIEAQKEVAQAYIEAIQNGDIDTANSYCTDDFSDAFEIKSTYDEFEDLLSKYNLEDTYGSQADQAIAYICQKVFKEYSMSDNTDSVQATISAIDISQIKSDVKSAVKTYIKNNMSSIASTVMSSGTQAAIEQYAPDAVDYVYSQVQDEVNNLDYKDYKVTFTFEKVDGEWKISKTEKTEIDS